MSGKKTMIKSVLIGTLCAVLAQIILLCIVSLVMISTKKLFTGALDYIMIAVSAIGSLIGGFSSANKALTLSGTNTVSATVNGEAANSDNAVGNLNGGSINGY